MFVADAAIYIFSSNVIYARPSEIYWSIKCSLAEVHCSFFAAIKLSSHHIVKLKCNCTKPKICQISCSQEHIINGKQNTIASAS